jgi:hypothetical protein
MDVGGGRGRGRNGVLMGVFEQKASARDALLKGKAHTTVDLLIKIGSFAKKVSV